MAVAPLPMDGVARFIADLEEEGHEPTRLGLLFGNLAPSIGDLVADNPAMAEILASGASGQAPMTFPFLVTILQIIAIIAAVMGIQVALRIYAEETDCRVEPLLAGSLRRPTYLASHALIALAGPLVTLLVAGTALGLVVHAEDDTVAVRDVISQAAATVPAVWVLVGLALAAVGAAPSRRVIAWLGVVATFGLTILGPTFKLPDRILDLSPLRHVPNVTATSPDWAGLGWVCAVAVVLVVTGFAGFRRRDLI